MNATTRNNSNNNLTVNRIGHIRLRVNGRISANQRRLRLTVRIGRRNSTRTIRIGRQQYPAYIIILATLRNGAYTHERRTAVLGRRVIGRKLTLGQGHDKRSTSRVRLLSTLNGTHRTHRRVILGVNDTRRTTQRNARGRQNQGTRRTHTTLVNRTDLILSTTTGTLSIARTRVSLYGYRLRNPTLSIMGHHYHDGDTNHVVRPTLTYTCTDCSAPDKNTLLRHHKPRPVRITMNVSDANLKTTDRGHHKLRTKLGMVSLRTTLNLGHSPLSMILKRRKILHQTRTHTGSITITLSLSGERILLIHHVLNIYHRLHTTNENHGTITGNNGRLTIKILGRFHRSILLY